MSDPISVVCLILLLWLVVRDLSRKTFRPESPLLPQHQNSVRYTVPLYAAEQQSASEHQHQEEALPPKAQYIHLEHEPVSSARVQPLRTVPLSIPSVPQERNEAPLKTSPQQINESGQSPILVPQPFVSPTNSGGQATVEVPQCESVHIHRVAGTPLVSDVSGASQSPQDDLGEGSGDYARLQERAKEEAEATRKYRKEKKEARANGQTVLVQELTKEVKKHKQLRQLLDEQASSLIFAKHNKNRSPDEVDLHGLTADEAKTHAKRVISDAREKGIIEIRFIVGKGLHSLGPPVLKPSILKLMKKLKLSAQVDPSNEGVLIVQLPSAKRTSPPAVFQECDQTLPQQFSPQTSLSGQSPVLFPEVHFSFMVPDQQIDDASQIPVENCPATPAPNLGEEVSHLPEKSLNNNVDNEGNNPVMIRERAKEERKLMLSYRKEKKLAQARGQMALTRELEEKESEYEQRSELLNAQASELIFAENNKSGPLDVVVLLNLKPKEAKHFAKIVIKKARELGMNELRMVVGEKPYSSDGTQPIKPVLMKFLGKQCGIPVRVDPANNKVLVVGIGPECDNI